MKTADIVIASDFRLTGGTSAAITAIVPTYNRAHLLGDCLDSLLAQTRPLDQIIVADDFSKADPVKYVEAPSQLSFDAGAWSNHIRML